MAVNSFKTYNQAKQDTLFATSLEKVVNESTQKESLQIKNNNGAVLGTALPVGRADEVALTFTAPDGDTPSSLGVNLKDYAGESISSVSVSNVVGTEFTQTLKNKTIDCATSGEGAGGNTITNLTTTSLADAAKATTVAVAASAVDTKLPTEKAVRTELNKKIDKIQLNGTEITYTAGDVNTVNIPVATADAVGVVKVDNNTIKVDSNGVISAQETITYSMASEDPSAEETADYVKIYHLTKTVGSAAAVNVGQAIKIPRDFLVKDSKVVTAAAYASGVAIEKYAILLHTEDEVDVPYVFKAAVTAADNTNWDAVKVNAEKITSINVTAGDKIIVFVVNNQQETASNKYIFIKVADLLTVYTAGNGLTLDANHQFSVVLTENGGLEFAGTEGSKTIGVKTDASTLEVSSDGKVQVKASGIDTAQIKDAAVTSAKIGGGEVKTVNILDANVTTAKIADGNVTTAKVADDAITSAKLADVNTEGGAAVAAENIQASAVTTVKIADANVTTAKLADDAVTSDKLADINCEGGAAVATDNIQASAVATAKIADDAVTEAKVANALLCKLYNITEADGVLTFTQLEEQQA